MEQGSPELRRLPVVEKVIDREMVAFYAQSSGDLNPLHLDPQFAASTRFGQIVAHGMLTLAFVSQMLTLAFGSHWVERGGLKVRFKGPAFLGDRVTTWGEVARETEEEGSRRLECSVGLRNQKGDELISGAATVWLPKDWARPGMYGDAVRQG